MRGQAKKGPRVCGWCGKTFEGTKKARWCGPRCKMAAHRHRKKMSVTV